MKKFISFLLAAILLLACCGCGQSSVGAFRALDTVGTKRYSVICRGDDKLAPAVNAAVNYLAAGGTLSALSTQWLGGDHITLSGSGELPGEAEFDAAERTLIVGVEAGFNPMAFERGGELVGLSVDIGKYIGAVLNCPVVFQPISSSDVGAQLTSGNIDCAVGFDPALVDSSKYDVGDVYLESDIVLAVPGGSEVKRIRDLKGQRIGITEDSVVEKALKSDEKITKYASGATVYLSADRCFDALENGWCAAVAMDQLRLLFDQPD